MPIEMIFLLLLRHQKRGRRDAKGEEEDHRPHERKSSKSEKTFFFSTTTHRHFDASGRLPADFHVEEHDWVGHDDDDFACAIVQRKNAKIRRRRNSFPLFFCQKKERKSADNFTPTSTQK